MFVDYANVIKLISLFCYLLVIQLFKCSPKATIILDIRHYCTVPLMICIKHEIIDVVWCWACWRRVYVANLKRVWIWNLLVWLIYMRERWCIFINQSSWFGTSRSWRFSFFFHIIYSILYEFEFRRWQNNSIIIYH